MAKTKLKQLEKPQLLKLDLGCGKNKRQGFVGVDEIKFDGVDQVLDLRKPWPWKDGSVEEAHCSHFLEHLTQDERVHFFNELYRVLIKGGKAQIITPHWLSERAYGDPTHKMPPVVFFSYFYINANWREQNAPHSGYTCDFDASGANNTPAPWNARAEEVRLFAESHYANVASDLYVTVVKR